MTNNYFYIQSEPKNCEFQILSKILSSLFILLGFLDKIIEKSFFNPIKHKKKSTKLLVS